MELSYGNFAAAVERFVRVFLIVTAGFFVMPEAASAQSPPPRDSKPIKLAVLGDSLTAGYGLPASAAFPVRLQKALQNKGIMTDIINAGVSGDTTTGGRDRLDWSIPPDTDAVIVELGANDALRGIDPKTSRAALEDILKKLKSRKIAAMLCGMYAPPNYGPDYASQFNSIYPELAKAYNVPLYPFFLDGVATDGKLNQADGIHPTAAGVDIIVSRILPAVETFLQNRERQTQIK